MDLSIIMKGPAGAVQAELEARKAACRALPI